MSALSKIWKSMLGVVNWCEQLAKWPFSMIFGNGTGRAMHKPEYKPEVSAIELLNELEENRAMQAAIHTLDRDGVDTVLRYAKATKAARATFDLSCVREGLRNTLLDMSNFELDALGRAGISAVRKFVEGREHGVFGVRMFTLKAGAKTASLKTKQEMTAEKRMVHIVRAAHSDGRLKMPA